MVVDFACHIHEKLTEDNFQLNPSSRMRNTLGEDVLDRKMIILMKVYKFASNTLYANVANNLKILF